MLFPREPVPALEFDTLSGNRWKLSEQAAENLNMIIVYRGKHCPICKAYTSTLNERVADFRRLGVEPIIVSADTEERAREAKEEWGLNNLEVGYGLDIAMGREWGLYVSDLLREGDPALFFEPGMFLVRPDGTLFYISVQNMPFGRPDFGQLGMALARAIEMKIPARGQVKA